MKPNNRPRKTRLQKAFRIMIGSACRFRALSTCEIRIDSSGDAWCHSLGIVGVGNREPGEIPGRPRRCVKVEGWFIHWRATPTPLLNQMSEKVEPMLPWSQKTYQVVPPVCIFAKLCEGEVGWRNCRFQGCVANHALAANRAYAFSGGCDVRLRKRNLGNQP